MSFNKFSFNPQINAGIQAAGYQNPTAIQQQSIPAILEGKDLLGLAQTGTGKTAAFVLPMLQRLMQGKRGRLRALIISPTRELAEQTNTAIRELARKTGVRSISIYGGVSSLGQIRGIRGGAEIAVACPGRLLDLMDQKIINLAAIEMLVLDEADQMFDMGFLPTIKRIIKQTPATRQTLLFSATMPAEIRQLAQEFLHDPVSVEIGMSKPVETVSHFIYPSEQTQKTKMLLSILNQAGFTQVLIFTRTKHRAKKLADQLGKAGISATSLQGNLSQANVIVRWRIFAAAEPRSWSQLILPHAELIFQRFRMSLIMICRIRSMHTPTALVEPVEWNTAASLFPWRLLPMYPSSVPLNGFLGTRLSSGN